LGKKVRILDTEKYSLSKKVTKGEKLTENGLELSKFDIEVLKNLPERYDWLVRTHHGSLVLYKGDEPHKFIDGTIWLSNTDHGTYFALNGVLSGLTFESEPLNILETLKAISYMESNK
jgi:hypothetical protein